MSPEVGADSFFNGTEVEVSFDTVPGRIYRLMVSEDLGAADPWRIFMEPIIGDGATFTAHDPAGLPGSRFYQFMPVP